MKLFGEGNVVKVKAIVYLLCRVFDRNSDGFLSCRELRDVLLNLGEKMTTEDIDEMMRLADQNSDGKIDYEGTS